jgi:hypothetical protein
MRLSPFFLFVFLVHFAPASAQKTVSVPLTPDAWDAAENRVDFLTYRGEPALRLYDPQGNTGGSVPRVKDLEFTNGTIEYDVAFTDSARFTTCYFRLQDGENTEHVYLRTNFVGDPNAMAAVQYAATVDGVNYWDLSPHYQTSADLKGDGEWNHVRIVVRDRQLLAYVNDMERPNLYVPILDGEIETGGVGVDGNVYIANLKITPDETQGLGPGEGYDPVHNDPRYLRQWEVTAPRDFPFGTEPKDEDFPTDTTNWVDISAEHHGMINLSRRYGGTSFDGTRRLAWLRTTITADGAQDRYLDLGFTDEAYVFLNGRHLFVGKNQFGSPGQLPPAGRMSIENSRIKLPLREGENELLIGLTNYFYGWGLVARLDDSGRLRF